MRDLVDVLVLMMRCARRLRSLRGLHSCWVPKSVLPAAGMMAAAILSFEAAIATSTAERAFENDFGAGGVSVGRPTGFFRMTKIGNRWLWVAPDGMAFWALGVYKVNVFDALDDHGGRYRARVIAKYGDADLRWAPEQLRRLKAWGFNTVGEYSLSYTQPWAAIKDPRWPSGTQPVKVPAVPFPLQAAWYSQTSLFSYAAGPVKELYWALDTHFNGYRGQFPDIFDPNFEQWIARRRGLRRVRPNRHVSVVAGLRQ